MREGCGGRLSRTNYTNSHPWNVIMRPTILYANFKDYFTKERKQTNKNQRDKNFSLNIVRPLQQVPSALSPQPKPRCCPAAKLVFAHKNNSGTVHLQHLLSSARHGQTAA